MMIRFACFLILSHLLFACQSVEHPKVLDIDNIKILNASMDQITFKADLVLSNPNAFGLELSSADIDVLLDDVSIGKMTQSLDATMPAKTQFSIPMHIALNLKKLYAENPLDNVGKALQILSKKELNLQFVGEVKAGKGKFKLNIPVEQDKQINF